MTATNENFTLGRVMIVDDEAELMNVLCEMLSIHGYETQGFTAGADALQALAEQDCDILLTDLMMPGMDGIALLKAGLEIDPNLVGIIMTGQGTIQTAVEAIKLRAFDYMLKPFKLAALLPVLLRAMEVRHLRMENMQLHETVAIHELGKAIAFSSDLSDILSKVADAALQQCGADEASIMLPTRDGKELYVAVIRGGHGSHTGERLPLDQGVAGWVARHREPVILKGGVDDPRFSPINPRADIRAAVSMPLLAGGKLVGVLNVNVTRAGHHRFTLGQVKALSILASIIAPVLENSQLYIQVRQAEEKYRSIFENAIAGITQTTPAGQFISANRALAAMLGYDSPEELMTAITDIPHQLYVDQEERTAWRQIIETCGKAEKHEIRFYRKDGSIIWVSFNMQAVRDEKGSLLYYEGTAEDISERKRREKQQALTGKILQTLNRPNEIINLIRDIILLLKAHLGIEAVAIRLREGDDFPYYETNGFPQDFLKTEGYLCERDDAGEIIRDSLGNPSLACMCGNIICGRTDPSFTFFTEGGSFWTNSTTELLASTSEEDRQALTRNRCNAEGYESVALIPLRSGDATIGLLQLNDARRRIFTLDMIRFLEGIGASISIAIARLQSVESLRESEEKYRLHFEHVTDIIFSLGPDLRLISISPSVERALGYKPEELVGKTISEPNIIVPSSLEKAAFSIKRTLAGGKRLEAVSVEYRAKDGTTRFGEVNASPVFQDGKAVAAICVSRDITERKVAEGKIEQSFKKLQKNIDDTIKAMSMIVETRDPYTAGHQERVSKLAVAIANELHLSEEQIAGIRMAGATHDIGKISVPAEILSKPGRLSNIEFSLIKVHSQAGYDILKGIDFSQPIAEMVLQHQERMDGSGYPKGLKGEEILIEARILAVADVMEAMAMHRPYRSALGVDAALEEIEKHKGILYDAAAADVCLALFREKGYQFQ